MNFLVRPGRAGRILRISAWFCFRNCSNWTQSCTHLSDKNFGACGGHFFTGRGRWSQLPRRAFLGRPLNYREVKRILFRHDTIVHTTQSDIFTCRDVLLCAGNIVEPTILFCLCQSRPSQTIEFLF